MPPAARRAVPLRLALGCLLALSACLLPAAASAAPVSAPAWSFAVGSYPTNFVPGTTGAQGVTPGYLVVATNIGGAATSGSFTISDTLPSGLGFSTLEGAYGSYGPLNEELTCSRAGQTVTCSGGVPSLKPGQTVQLWIPVKVAANAPGSVINEATLSGGGAFPVSAETETTVGGQLPPFGFVGGSAGLRGAITDAEGSPATQAGSHPYQFSAVMSFPASGSAPGELLAAGGGVRDLAVDLPRGMVVDASATPVRCTEAELESAAGGAGCPEEAQVGTVALILGLTPKLSSVALYDMVPPPGVAVDLGLEASEGAYVHLRGGLRSESDYGLSAEIRDISAKLPVLDAEVTLWGNPSDASHDFARGSCLREGGACPVPRTDAAFLTLPGSCAGPIATGARADSWIEPGAWARAGAEGAAVDGCNALEFAPTISAQPTTTLADSPTGLGFDLRVPQSSGYEGLATANLKDVEVALPKGLAINPSGADGLAACTAAQVGLLTAPGQTPIRFASVPSTCPDSAKIGTVEIGTPILSRPLRGAIYLAQPDRNPFGSLLAIYLVLEDPQSGTVAKLAGRVEADPGSGRLTLALDEAPELPLEDVRLDFFGGSRALLKTPFGCGTYVTNSDLTPWSGPEGADAVAADGFSISAAPGGTAPCPGSEATAPHRPGFSAGTIAPRAGAHSPFVLELSREDGSQRLSSLDLTTPPGLAGRLAGIPYCPEPRFASCPDASRVGTVEIGAGAGAAPLFLAGNAYLAGPYKGAPLSLVVAVPALAGPFDLGDVVVRTALHVDPRTAQIHAVSDPLPTILRGIPLDVRSVALRLDRPDFIRNPTSCDPMTVTAAATSAAAQRASLLDRFQVGGCRRLGFRPRLAIRFFGPTHRGAHPRVRTVFQARASDANIARAAITLPRTELLENRHIATVCARDRFAAGRCPADSIYGWAKAWSPLLGQPIEGPVYLRASRRRLPDLVASLDGQVHLDLVGHVDSVGGRLRNTFAALPDAPLSKLVLTMRGGRRGLLVNATELCRAAPRANAELDAQNGKALNLAPAVKLDCG